MVPTAFDEETGVLGPPRDMSLEECQVLSVFQGADAGGFPVTISCWKPDSAEMEEIKRTGRVWLIIYGEGMPPAALAGLSPFIQADPTAVT